MSADYIKLVLLDHVFKTNSEEPKPTKSHSFRGVFLLKVGHIMSTATG